MSRLRTTRQADGESGAYAILYAVLVVVLLGMGAIVVDLAAVRQDRRLDRSVTDSAATAGAPWLDPATPGGASPYQACLSAWAYIGDALKDSNGAKIGTPVGACSSFVTINAASYCSVASPAEITDDVVVGSRTVRVAWPIPATGGSGFLNADIAPGNIAQDFDSSVDGDAKGCDKLGVAIFETHTFGIGAGIGAGGTETQAHSVALFTPSGPDLEGVAALNVLNPDECGSLITTGGGKVLVGAVLQDGVPVGPGTIAVESSGTASGSSCNGGNKVIDPTTGGGSLICASSVLLVTASSCDGDGVILSHALDPGGDPSKAYSTAATSGGNLDPVPTPEDGVHGWNPVTKRYGCNTSALSPCTTPTTNYVALLESAYGTSGTPSVYAGGQAPYSSLYTLPFQATAAICGNVDTVVVLAPGNWYADCSISVRNGGTVIVQGGNLVVGGGLEIQAGGCFAMNSAVNTCPTSVTGSGTLVTSPVPPVADSILYLRNGSINTSGSLVIPQTFVYSRSTGNTPVNVQSTALTLWTAPGAGAKNGWGRTTLEETCYDATAGEIVKACMDSRFGRLAYWSDYPAPKTKANNFAGQGSLNVVGVFFTPRAYFDFAGGGSYTAAAAQFWADKLNVTGGAVVGLVPDAKFAVESPLGRIGLIR